MFFLSCTISIIFFRLPSSASSTQHSLFQQIYFNWLPFILHNQQKILYSFSFSLFIPSRALYLFVSVRRELTKLERIARAFAAHRNDPKPIWYAYAMACIYYSDSNYPMCLISQSSVFRCVSLYSKVAIAFYSTFTQLPLSWNSFWHCVRRRRRHHNHSQCRQYKKENAATRVFFSPSSLCVCLSLSVFLRALFLTVYAMYNV